MSTICASKKYSILASVSLLLRGERSLSIYEQWTQTAARISDAKMWLKGVSVGLSGLFLAPLPGSLSKHLAKSYSNIKDFRSVFIFPGVISNVIKLYKEVGDLDQKASKSKKTVWTSPSMRRRLLTIMALSANAVSNIAKVATRLVKVQARVLDQLGLFMGFLGLFSNFLKGVIAAIKLKNLCVKSPHSELYRSHAETKKKWLAVKLVSKVTNLTSGSLSIAAFFTAAVFSPHLLAALATLSFGLSLTSRLHKQSVKRPLFSRGITPY